MTTRKDTAASMSCAFVIRFTYMLQMSVVLPGFSRSSSTSRMDMADWAQ
jgi:hypothetical protein